MFSSAGKASIDWCFSTLLVFNFASAADAVSGNISGHLSGVRCVR